jgi:hypothetical protein
MALPNGQHMNGPDREEKHAIQGGEALFEIRGGEFDYGLLFRGTPVALLWCDCQGSIAQFLVRSRRSLDVSSEVRHLRHITDGGFDPDLPIAPQIAPLLALFADGEYRLTYEAMVPDCDVVEFSEASSLLNHRESFYPFDWTLVTTRPRASLDVTCIDYYQARIGSGVRPLVLLVGLGYAYLVLDGHHKLAAYRLLGSPPAVLCIDRLEPPRLTPEVARDAFTEASSFYESYLHLKRDFDR